LSSVSAKGSFFMPTLNELAILVYVRTMKPQPNWTE
jgi:hypothetical protein